MLTYLKHMALAAAAALCATPAAQAADQPQEWELINPTGEIEKVAVEPAKRITALEGKTIALRWNGKNNGDVVLDHLCDLMGKKFPNTRFVKIYQKDPSTVGISGSAPESERIARSMVSLNPDLVIAAQGD